MSRGRYFEELEVGQVFYHRPGRTVGEADNTLFSTLTMNPQSLHLDEEFARQTEFGQRVVNSLFTLATTVGLSVRDLTLGTTVANLGFQEIRFPKPVFHGDTLYAETEVVSKRPSRSRPGQGIVEFEHRARNQRGDLVMVARRSALMLCGPAEAASLSSTPVTPGGDAASAVPRPGQALEGREPAVPLPGPALLFCPGNRSDRFAKALKAGDAAILDLEDAVPPAQKTDAREQVVKALAELGPERIVVRVNAVGTPWHGDDVDAIRRARARWAMLPKAERPSDVASLAPMRVIALCETAGGVLRAPAIAAVPNCAGIMWGGEDLTRDLGGWSSRGPDGRYLFPALVARTMVLLAAAAARRVDGAPVAIDAPYLAIQDTDGCRAEAAEAARLGFGAKAAIHPAQCDLIRDAFRPRPEQVSWAQEVVRLAQEHRGEVFVFEGQMIDEPLVAKARRILVAARREDQNGDA